MVFWSYIGPKEYWVTSEHFAKKREGARARAKKHYHKNKPLYSEKALAWRAKNKERHLNNFRKWYSENKEHCLEKRREWAKNNKEKLSSYCKTNQGLARNRRMAAIRRALKRKVSVSESNEEAFLYAFCQAISKGSGVKHHVDHIVPISRGGSHAIENLRIVPAVVNLRKGCKMVRAA